ncbi:MAG: MFS transporter [Sciscionella sp.]
MSLEQQITPTITDTGTRSARVTAFFAASLGWLLDGYENFAIILVAGLIVSDFIGPHASPLYIAGILAAQLVAWAIGGMCFGIIADYIGRRRALMIAILWYAIFAAISAASPNYTVLLILRIVTGFGLGAEWGNGNTLLAEHLKVKTRGRWLGFFAGSFGIGFLLATVVWLGVSQLGPYAWRWMFVIGVAPALLTLFIRMRVKEPDTWVRAHRDRRAARGIAAGGGLLGDRDKALLTFTWLRPFQDPKLRRQLIMLLLMSLSCLVGWWTVATRITAMAGVLGASLPDVGTYKTLVAVSYNVGGIIGYFAMGFLVDRFGRKPVIFCYFLGSLITTPILFFPATASTTLFLWVAGVNGIFSLGLMGWMGIYPAEVFPTYIRATAITIVFNLTRFIVAVMIIFSGELITLFGGIAEMAGVMSAIYILGCAITFFAGPETRNQPLPE